MKKLILSLLAALSIGGAAQPPEGGVAWDKFPAERVTELAALQHGAKLFANYCLNCHAATFVRYNRLTDIGLTTEEITQNLVFTGQKVGDTMRTALDPHDAKKWFGATPPDLSVIARSRAAAGQGSGADYLYTYLRSYYRDDTKTTGWNNLVFPSVAMPHALWELQGMQVPVHKEIEDAHDHGKKIEVVSGFQLVTPGKLTPEQYNETVADLVAFLQWMGEPAQTTRERIGVWVLLFLGVFTIFAWRLNAAYWKDVE